MKEEPVITQARKLAESLLVQKGMELVDIEYKMEQGRWVLRLFIDKPGGVTLDDCGSVSTELGVILDVEDIIPNSYNLEVSSPGLDRPLIKEQDFLKYAGRKIRVKTKQPLSGRRNFTGTLNGFKNGKVSLIDSNGIVWEIPFESIEKARLEYRL